MSTPDSSRIERGDLHIAACLYDFIEQHALPNSGVSSDVFWQGFEQILTEFTPRNESLLARRDELQVIIDKLLSPPKTENETSFDKRASTVI
mgnify:CR=1 FL=1